MEQMPKYVAESLDALQAERGPLAARLDAIDLAIHNLRRVWPACAAKATVKPKANRRRALRVVVSGVASGGDSEAAVRRQAILSIIGKSAVGLTLGELRAQTPKMDPKARTNALQTLKAAKQIRRAGNAWVAVSVVGDGIRQVG